MNNKSDNLEYEIDLVKYSGILKKWIWLILAIVVISLTITWYVLSGKPKTYEVSMILEPPRWGLKDGQIQYLVPVDNLGARIAEGIFNQDIIKDQNMSENNNFNFKVNSSKVSGTVEVTIMQREGEQQQGLKMLNSLYRALASNYAGIIKQYTSNLDRDIMRTKSTIMTKRNEIELIMIKLKYLDEREAFLEKEIEEAKRDREELGKKRDSAIENKERRDDISKFLYTNIIQQSIQYYNQICNQLVDLKVDKKMLTLQANNIQGEITNLEAEEERIKNSMDNIGNVKMVQPPKISNIPIAVKNTRKMIMAGMVSLAFSFLLALSLEAIKNAKKS